MLYTHTHTHKHTHLSQGPWTYSKILRLLEKIDFMFMVLNKYLDFNAIGCSPETDIKTPLLKTPPTELIEHGNIELVPA